MTSGDLSEIGPLRRVLVKHARDAFVSQRAIDRDWSRLHYTAPPDFSRAVDEYDRFLELLCSTGAEAVQLPRDERVNLDSIYTRDASMLCSRGSILGCMGKAERGAEPAVQEHELQRIGWPQAGRIAPPGHLEGGDVLWLAPRTVAVGLGYRTDAEGIRQFRALLGESVDEFFIVPLPHGRGPADVMHLMSLVSVVDRDLAVV
jgi:N-dimethylarginine dimethylaminohydrolase